MSPCRSLSIWPVSPSFHRSHARCHVGFANRKLPPRVKCGLFARQLGQLIAQFEVSGASVASSRSREIIDRQPSNQSGDMQQLGKRCQLSNDSGRPHRRKDMSIRLLALPPEGTRPVFVP